MGLVARGVQVFACRDEHQAVMWLLRGNAERNTPGLLPLQEPLQNIAPGFSGWQAGMYSIEQRNTLPGCSAGRLRVSVAGDSSLQHDLLHH